jgi:hypothetical protein
MEEISSIYIAATAAKITKIKLFMYVTFVSQGSYHFYFVCSYGFAAIISKSVGGAVVW